MRIAIHVRPGARVAAVGGLHADSLIVRVREPAVDGKATKAAIAALATALGLPSRDVVLVAGAASRHKIIEVPDSAAARIESLRRRDR